MSFIIGYQILTIPTEQFQRAIGMFQQGWKPFTIPWDVYRSYYSTKWKKL